VTTSTYVYPTPSAVEPSVLPPSSKTKLGFCASARRWAIDLGMFTAATQTIAGPGLYADVYFEQHVHEAQGLRDNAPDDEASRYTPSFELRLRLYRALQKIHFRMDHLPPDVKRLVRQEVQETLSVFTILKDRCGISRKQLRRGVAIYNEAAGGNG
jgi:hypothetical protein